MGSAKYVLNFFSSPLLTALTISANGLLRRVFPSCRPTFLRSSKLYSSCASWLWQFVQYSPRSSATDLPFSSFPLTSFKYHFPTAFRKKGGLTFGFVCASRRR